MVGFDQVIGHLGEVHAFDLGERVLGGLYHVGLEAHIHVADGQRGADGAQNGGGLRIGGDVDGTHLQVGKLLGGGGLLGGDHFPETKVVGLDDVAAHRLFDLAVDLVLNGTFGKQVPVIVVPEQVRALKRAGLGYIVGVVAGVEHIQGVHAHALDAVLLVAVGAVGINVQADAPVGLLLQKGIGSFQGKVMGIFGGVHMGHFNDNGVGLLRRFGPRRGRSAAAAGRGLTTASQQKGYREESDSHFKKISFHCSYSFRKITCSTAVQVTQL